MFILTLDFLGHVLNGMGKNIPGISSENRGNLESSIADSEERPRLKRAFDRIVLQNKYPN